jgi:tRNA A-37 threonylcarbamoyl transferase component Bud32
MPVQTIVAGGLTWRVTGENPGPKLQKLFNAPDDFLRQPDLVLKKSAVATVARIPGDGEAFWILKQFRPRKGFKVLKGLRQSRAIREFETAALLQKAGILTPRAIAVAERRRGPMLQSGYLLTEGIPNAITLRDFLAEETSAAKRARVVKTFAETLGELYRAEFAHSDLNPANFLVQVSETNVRIWFIDLEGIQSSRPLSVSGIARDLRRLNRRVQVPPVVRVRFLKQFCQACEMQWSAEDVAALMWAGHREWEVRRFGKYRWKVRMNLLNGQARELMAQPDAIVGRASVGDRSVNVQATEKYHPGFVMLQVKGDPAESIDNKTVGYTAPLFGKGRRLLLKIRSVPPQARS